MEKHFSRMNVEKLISMVYEKNAIWDMTDKNYQMRHIQRKLWSEIAYEMEYTVDDVKKKWRNLRDTFRKEYQKSYKSLSGDEDNVRILATWPYFQQMMFLAGNFKQIKLDRNMSDESEGNNLEEIMLWDQHDDTNSQNPITVEPEKPVEPLPKKTLKRTKKQHLKKCLKKCKDGAKPINELLKIMQQTNEDKFNSDYQFLLSLLPYLKKVPHSRKLLVRMKLQQVLMEEEPTFSDLASS